MATDGLDLLEQSRKTKTARRARVVPPPHHPKPAAEPDCRTEPAADAEQTPAAAGEQNREPAAAAASAESVRPPAGAPTRSRRRRQPAPDGGGDLEKLQFYVDAPVRDYLHEVRKVVVNRNDRKLDVSASAVIRLAVHRLAGELSPEQVVDLLGSRTTTDRPGRKRR